MIIKISFRFETMFQDESLFLPENSNFCFSQNNTIVNTENWCLITIPPSFFLVGLQRLESQGLHYTGSLAAIVMNVIWVWLLR